MPGFRDRAARRRGSSVGARDAIAVFGSSISVAGAATLVGRAISILHVNMLDKIRTALVPGEQARVR